MRKPQNLMLDLESEEEMIPIQHSPREASIEVLDPSFIERIPNDKLKFKKAIETLAETKDFIRPNAGHRSTKVNVRNDQPMLEREDSKEIDEFDIPDQPQHLVKDGEIRKNF